MGKSVRSDRVNIEKYEAIRREVEEEIKAGFEKELKERLDDLADLLELDKKSALEEQARYYQEQLDILVAGDEACREYLDELESELGCLRKRLKESEWKKRIKITVQLLKPAEGQANDCQ